MSTIVFGVLGIAILWTSVLKISDYSVNYTYSVWDKKINSIDYDGVYVLAAEWCGHCKALKKSGEIDKLAEQVNVQVIYDDNKLCQKLMDKTGASGFPSILFNKNGSFTKYEGQRKSKDIYNEYLIV